MVENLVGSSFLDKIIATFSSIKLLVLILIPTILLYCLTLCYLIYKVKMVTKDAAEFIDSSAGMNSADFAQKLEEIHSKKYLFLQDRHAYNRCFFKKCIEPAPIVFA